MSTTEANNNMKKYIFTCKNSDAVLVVLSLLAIGMITLFIEFTRNVLTSGIITSMAIVLASLIFFGGLLLFDIKNVMTNNQGDRPYSTFAFVLLFINILINVIAMVWFMSIFFPPDILKKINNKYVFSYLNNPLIGFLGVLCIYLLFNYYIYSQLKCGVTHIPVLIMLLLIFAFTECIIQILLLIMINNYLHKITDG